MYQCAVCSGWTHHIFGYCCACGRGFATSANLYEGPDKCSCNPVIGQCIYCSQYMCAECFGTNEEGSESGEPRARGDDHEHYDGDPQCSQSAAGRHDRMADSCEHATKLRDCYKENCKQKHGGGGGHGDPDGAKKKKKKPRCSCYQSQFCLPLCCCWGATGCKGCSRNAALMRTVDTRGVFTRRQIFDG